MLSSFHAEIINLSQSDKSIFEKFPVLGVRKRFLGFVKIYTVTIPSADAGEAVAAIQTNMSNALGKEWYVTLHNAVKAIIVFRQRIFELSAEGVKPVYRHLLNTSGAVDKSGWDEMIAYAKSLGIPDDQCDFLPPFYDAE